MARRCLVGETFGRLLVLSEEGTRGLICRCSCRPGTIKRVDRYSVLYGTTRSCGCLLSEISFALRYRHGKKRTRIHWVWSAMKSRCLNPNNKDFGRYGGRGITVCDRWMDFRNFYADMGDPPPKHTLERKNNNLGYSPENCIWATQDKQTRNRENVRRLSAGGETMLLIDWARRLGTGPSVIRNRLKRGWGESRAVTEPIRPCVRRRTA
jgi:hypothetical protein